MMVSGKATQNVNAAESLQDIGERLRILRLQKDLDIETICKKTNIPVKHLKSIESGDLDALPEWIYVRGFVRRYAQELQQDIESFDLGARPDSLQTSPNPFRAPIHIGALIHKLKYPLYAALVVGVGSGLIYLNNRELSPAPAQSGIETPVVSQSSP